MPESFYEIFNYAKVQTYIAQIEEFINKADSHKQLWAVSQSHQPCVLDRFIGLEVEVEKLKKFDLPNNPIWTHKEDGSLRNNGREYISIPVKGKNIPFALQLLRRGLDKFNPGYEFSERCSVHVHMNCRDMTPQQLFSLILMYVSTEELLFSFVDSVAPHPRRYNIFCPTLKDSNKGKFYYFFKGCMEDGSVDSYRVTTSLDLWPKYTALNLKPMAKLGTIEFRHMGGTADVDVLMRWINIILRLSEAAVRLTPEKLFKTFQELNSNSQYEAFIHQVYREQAFDLVPFLNMDTIESNITWMKEMSYVGKHCNLMEKNVQTSPYWVKLYGNAKKEKTVVKKAKLATYVAGDTIAIGPDTNILADILAEEPLPHQLNLGNINHD